MERTTTREIIPSTEYLTAVKENADRWVAACGGSEEPFTHNGVRWLYVYNPRREEHGYLNMGTDIVQPEAPWNPV